MAACAVLGICATIAFITVGWPGTMGRSVIGIVIFSAIGFLACASAAVFSAARDTYPRRASTRGASEDRPADEPSALEDKAADEPSDERP
ncbi:hypothetical protein BH24ACT26_BH24ACT26_16410 [soil metagenome]